MTPTATTPPFKAMASFRTFTGAEYDRMVEHGVLTSRDRVELLEGYVVSKTPGSPPHDFTVGATDELLGKMIPPEWALRCQLGTNLTDSRPEPDLAIVRGPRRSYATRHPGAADIGLVIEVSDSSLDRDQLDKTRIYARDRIPVYWVVNLVDRRVEVYTGPNGPGDDPRYHTLRVFPAGTAVPVELDGVTIGTVLVDDLLP